MPAEYSERTVGRPNTRQYRVYIERDGIPISSFHDVPLYADSTKSILNMVVEIPRWTNNKLEIARDEPLNPIHQDIKDGEVRYVKNIYPYHGYIWNYGAFPQTWEDPKYVHPETKAPGDNDPLDACEIGECIGRPGQIKQVKVLGILALLDGTETDWKAIVIDIKDPLAPVLKDIEDVESHLPGLLDGTKKWFRTYKIPDGKPENGLALNGEYRNKEYAMDIINGAARAWHGLVMGKADPGSISLTNVSIKCSPAHIGLETVPSIPAAEKLEPAPISSAVDKWFYTAGTL
ncbi:hypothetical protein VE02_10276 [Pseudogymnoascus sp. 03VT05]|nr:hypothetical protein VE02_10276 [Pseudogymnoascus sp. 03VT05]